MWDSSKGSESLMPPLGATGLTFLGLTIIVAMLVAVLAFAVLRFSAAARDSRSHLRESRTETALLSAALEEAIGKLKAQERATAARAEASERLSSEIVASLTSGLLVVNRSGVVQIVNPAARRILGLPDAATGQAFRQLLSLMPALADVIARGLESGSPIVRRRVALDYPGGPSCLGVTVSPLASATGTQEAVVCLFTDLTAVTALEEQLRLKEALARLGELTAGLAHEFRNGLATIHGYARLLDPAMLPEVYKPYVEGIRGETQAMGEVVTNFLNFARPEPLTLAPLDLGEVIRRAVDDMPDGFDVSVTGDFGPIDGDEVLLRRAFGNLLRNALEASEASGRPRAAHVHGERDPIGNLVRVSVRDQGPGIERAALTRLFQPFYTTKDHGTGLGLAIVQKVVVSHNGQVSAGNHPDGGAEFRVTLPASASQILSQEL
jgi:PAS domain S-box-containing protein